MVADPLMVPDSASYAVPLAILYVPDSKINDNYWGPRTILLTGRQIDTPNIRPYQLRHTATPAQGQPDVSTAPEEVGAPAIPHVNPVATEGKVIVVLGEESPRGLRSHVGLGRPGAREELRLVRSISQKGREAR